MSRRKIELAPGSIVPVFRGLWVAAVEKLHEAESGINIMKGSSNRIDYEHGWVTFTDSLQEFWVRFYNEGIQTFSKFKPWIGAVIKEKNEDELLRYIYQARHQSQHGRIALEWEEGLLNIAPNFFGYIYGMKIFDDGTYEFDSKPIDPDSPEPTITHSPGKPHLPVIHNKKYGQEYQPPKYHLGKPLSDNSPIAVSQIALQYYYQTLFKAFETFSENKA